MKNSGYVSNKRAVMIEDHAELLLCYVMYVIIYIFLNTLIILLTEVCYNVCVEPHL